MLLQNIYNLNPVAIKLFNIEIYWYGLAYFISFLIGYFIIHIFQKTQQKLKNLNIDKFLFYSIIGIMLGGRLGHIILYEFHHVFNPAQLFNILFSRGGMSFHGGLIGIGITTYIYAKKYKIPIPTLTDLISLIAPIGIFFGRIANAINQEILGIVTNSSLGVIYNRYDTLLRHPVSVYEAALEGIILFVICLYSYIKNRDIRTGLTTSSFIIFYSIFRYFCEFFKAEDIVILEQTYGQIISIIMFFTGLILLKKVKEKNIK